MPEKQGMPQRGPNIVLSSALVSTKGSISYAPAQAAREITLLLPTHVQQQDESDMVLYSEILAAYHSRKINDKEAGILADPGKALSNAKSALKSWLIFVSKAESDRVGAEFLTDFPKKIELFKKNCATAGLSSQAISDKTSLISRLQEHYLIIKAQKSGSLSKDLGTELTRLSLAADVTQKQISAATRVSIGSIKSMFRGQRLSVVTGRSNLHKIAYFFKEKGVLDNTERLMNLAVFAPSNQWSAINESKRGCNVLGGETMVLPARRQNPVAKYVESHPDIGSFNKQLRDYIDEVANFNINNGSWTVSENYKRVPSPYAFVDSNGRRMHYPSAQIFINGVTHFAGFLLQENHREKVEDIELRDFFDVGLLAAHQAFINRLSGGRRNGGSIKKVRDSVARMYEVLGEEYGSKSEENELWMLRFEKKFLLAKRKKGKSVKASCSLDYFPLINYFFDLNPDNPARPFYDIFSDLWKRYECSSLSSTSYVAIRDAVTLLVFLIFPARLKNMCTMRYKDDNSGDIFFDNMKQTYCLRFNSASTKNGKCLSYDFPSSLNKYFDEYINVARSFALERLDAPSDLFFLPANARGSGDVKPQSLDSRLAAITEAYFAQPLNPHFFRHFGASLVLYYNPGAWQIAADLIGDEVKTVMGVYGHLAKREANKKINSVHAVGLSTVAV